MRATLETQLRQTARLAPARLRKEFNRAPGFGLGLSIGDLLQTDTGNIISFAGISTFRGAGGPLSIKVLGYSTDYTAEQAAAEDREVRKLPKTLSSSTFGNVPITYSMQKKETDEQMRDNYWKQRAATEAARRH